MPKGPRLNPVEPIEFDLISTYRYLLHITYQELQFRYDGLCLLQLSKEHFAMLSSPVSWGLVINAVFLQEA
jgi:hypothetical protein